MGENLDTKSTLLSSLVALGLLGEYTRFFIWTIENIDRILLVIECLSQWILFEDHLDFPGNPVGYRITLQKFRTIISTTNEETPPEGSHNVGCSHHFGRWLKIRNFGTRNQIVCLPLLVLKSHICSQITCFFFLL